MSTKNWVFTLNNPEAGWNDLITTETLQYVVYQTEVGEAGTPHIQGYVVFKIRTSLKKAKEIIPKAHWAPRRGTHEQARQYCKKKETAVEGAQVEWGIPPTENQGKRTDLQSVAEKVKAGATLNQIVDEFTSTYIQFTRGIEAAINRLILPRSTKPTVVVYWGDAGVGKTRLAYKEALEQGEVYFKDETPWWEGYTGQQSVIFDDFYGKISEGQMLKLLDRYPNKVAIKGSSREFTSQHIFITSNDDPNSWYDWSKRNQGKLAFFRRIDRIEHMIHPPTTPVSQVIVNETPPELLRKRSRDKSLDLFE